ncbi:MAG: response regulator [Nitrospirae bacterium]|nr:response regulator [Nitrospirota bacterium]
MKLLIIDDEEEKCRLYREELQDEGYEILTATSGKKGIELFKKESPDLVTLDIWMSQKDEGINLLRQMKEIRPWVPIVMLTAYDFRDDFAIWCADAYIVKSSDLSELKGTLKNLSRGMLKAAVHPQG